MSRNVNSNTALLTEHLRHTPVSLIDDVINSINTIGYKAVDWVEQGLLGTPLSNLGFSDSASGSDSQDSEEIESQVRHEIENGVHQFETLLEATIDKNFDKMEIFALRSIIAIPDDLKDWIRLRHYEGLSLTPSLSPDSPTLASITLQRRKHQESLRLHRLLQAEAARNAALIQQLKSLLSLTPSSPQNPSSSFSSSSSKPPFSNPRPQDGEKEGEGQGDGQGEEGSNNNNSSGGSTTTYPALAFLSQTRDLPTSSTATPLATTTAFALSQLPAMKALLAEHLRPALQSLSSSPPLLLHRDPQQQNQPEQQDAPSEKSWRRQRLEYIESQTRRLLLHGGNGSGNGTVGGGSSGFLELGEQGRVRDGEWQEAGRRVGRAEVEALERVVGLVAGGGGSNGSAGVRGGSGGGGQEMEREREEEEEREEDEMDEGV